MAYKGSLEIIQELRNKITEYENIVTELKENIKDYEQSIKSLQKELDIKEEGKQGELL